MKSLDLSQSGFFMFCFGFCFVSINSSLLTPILIINLHIVFVLFSTFVVFFSSFVRQYLMFTYILISQLMNCGIRESHMMTFSVCHLQITTSNCFFFGNYFWFLKKTFNTTKNSNEMSYG